MITVKDIDHAIDVAVGNGKDRDVFSFDYDKTSYMLTGIYTKPTNIVFSYELDKPIAHNIDEFDLVEFFVDELNRVLNAAFDKMRTDDDEFFGTREISNVINRNDIDFKIIDNWNINIIIS